MPMPYEVRRETFIDAAMKVIREEGLAKATTRRIAEVANAPLGSLHYCFRSKDEVIEAVLQSVHDTGRAYLAEKITPQMGVLAASEALMRAFTDWIVEAPGDQLTEYELQIWAIRSTRYTVRPPVPYSGWIDTLVELLTVAERPDEPKRDLVVLAKLLLATSDGLNLQDRLMNENTVSLMTEHAITQMGRSIEAGDFDVPTRRRRTAATAKTSTGAKRKTSTSAKRG